MYFTIRFFYKRCKYYCSNEATINVAIMFIIFIQSSNMLRTTLFNRPLIARPHRNAITNENIRSLWLTWLWSRVCSLVQCSLMMKFESFEIMNETEGPHHTHKNQRNINPHIELGTVLAN